MSTKQERAVRTRRALIQAAAQVFERTEYVEARMDTISALAGMSRGALSFHFAGKEAVAGEIETRAAVALRRAVLVEHRRNTSALQALVDATHALALLVRTDTVVRGGLRLNCDARHRSRASLRAAWERYVRILLDEAAALGELREGAEPPDPYEVIIATTTGLQVLGLEDAAWLEARPLTHFWETLLPRIARAEALALLRPEGSPAAARTPGPRPSAVPARGGGAIRRGEPEPVARWQGPLLREYGRPLASGAR
ncbi:ScbR family autoregulator-binding transcription factor [Streptomyces sp. NPDC050560]|uniref:ScbR family autoregulator-binding transcription factor n=1 Tax=Streptomyces sp. NPDC050560 TaxID=3365630 RepID=UPI0037B3ACD1